MDALQFSLFFVAILVGYVLVHLRLVRFEEYLQKLAGIRGLDDRLSSVDDRLRQMAGTFDKLRLERIEGHLERLHDDLEELREVTGDVRHIAVPIPAPAAGQDGANGSTVTMPASEPPASRLVALVENRLLQLGYRNLRLLNQLGDVQLADEIEMRVECERSGMPVKGRVLLRNGSVHDVVMQPATQMFP